MNTSKKYIKKAVYFASLMAALSLPQVVNADVLTTELNEKAPTSYTVVKGDTLWDISGKFLKSPWKWPEIWSMNNAVVENPHWIYPGEVLNLEITNGKARLTKGKNKKMNELHLKPGVRFEELIGNKSESLPTVNMDVVKNFLIKPMIIENDDFKNAPVVISSEDGRMYAGVGSKIYVAGLSKDSEGVYSVYRKGTLIKDPENGKDLGMEAIHLGHVKVIKVDDVSTLKVISAGIEITQGDKLVKVQNEVQFYNTLSPAKEGLKAQVARVFNNTQNSGVSGIGDKTRAYEREGGPLSVIVLNKGENNGLVAGNVVQLNNKGAKVINKSKIMIGNSDREPSIISLPNDKNGQAVIFKTFENISYAVVMNVEKTVKVGDDVVSPSE